MNRLGLTHLSLRVDDLAGTVERLRAAGVKVLEQSRIDIPAFASAAVFVCDPDGTLIELVQSPGDLEAQTAGVICRKDRGVIDEIPGAYKDIDEVMANQSDLVEVVHTLKQIVCVKG